ncbi:PIN domain-containing protein [Nocardioides albus]|uniref:Putative nucleic acid-binding protein n=1 Tax=Nocardioides albus TaxID=1841 RepID=A0A7W5A572_9ACTN|nr:PIN domain-containing protein [Nocardioides albus]MBB3089700.1 putative nucleic acid-binding protein [Nocardioides albus]GGU29970.1 PIN domain-containing protein [Nocardioides albus]
MTSPVVIYDANVLYPSTLRDVLIRLGLADIVTPRWTETILDETFRNLRANRPDLDPSVLGRTRRLMGVAIPDASITGYEYLIDDLDLPDPDDRHVLAAALHIRAETIVTKNLRDFPRRVLDAHNARAVHPDAFLQDVHDEHPGSLPTIIRDIAVTWRSGTDVDVLASLAVEAPATSKTLSEGQ